MKKIFTTLTLTALVASTVAPAQAWSWKNGFQCAGEAIPLALLSGVAYSVAAGSIETSGERYEKPARIHSYLDAYYQHRKNEQEQNRHQVDDYANITHQSEACGIKRDFSLHNKWRHAQRLQLEVDLQGELNLNNQEFEQHFRDDASLADLTTEIEGIKAQHPKPEFLQQKLLRQAQAVALYIVALAFCIGGANK